MTLKPTGSYRMSKEIKRIITSIDDPEFKTWYKNKIIQCDLENELKSRQKPNKDKEAVPD